MEILLWLFVAAFGCMVVGFGLQFLKAWILDIKFARAKKRNPYNWEYRI